MKQLFNTRQRVALWVAMAVVGVMISAGTIFAAGEQLERGVVLSGGSTRSSNGYVMRDVIGLWASGSDIASSGAGLCSGFGCDVRSNATPDEPDEPDMMLFMPQIEHKE